ncbi:HNH endonuclease [Xanthobacter sp. VTT E-85241]|uniref:HNH endonuclease n=1 Tax=Roseixanthobacter finlandensis TaxID=3119922 RepID=UPI00372C8D90
MITQAALEEMFVIDTEGGRLFWKKPPYNHPRLLGCEAGTRRAGRGGKTYWVVKIGRQTFRRGRLIYLAVHGRFPEPCVDHINGDSVDDRIWNLREATVTENAWNHKTRKRRHDLPMGVRLIPKSGRFEARISCHGRQFHLGAYDTPLEAHGVYLAKRRELFHEFA